MMDAIDLLLRDKQHPDATKLREFHHANPDFLPRVVAEFRLLKQLGRRAGGVKALIHFLRWERHWHATDVFEIGQNLATFAARVCVLLWPDINGMVQFRPCAADEILDTRIVRQRGKRYANRLRHGERTLAPGCSFLPPEKSGTGLVQPIQWGEFPTVTTIPPDVPELDRPPTFHDLIIEAEAATIVEPLRRIAASSPHPRHPRLRAWVRHIETQPETFAFMERTLLDRHPNESFSAVSLLEYGRWSIQRAAESHKPFTLPGQFDGLYCRALIMRNPQYNGLCEFKADGSGKLRHGSANRLLGCTLAPEPIAGEPYRRLLWTV